MRFDNPAGKAFGKRGEKQNKNKHHKEKASNVLRWASSAVFAQFCAPTKSKKGKIYIQTRLRLMV